MSAKVNPKNTAVRRILADVRELNNHKTSRFHAVPLEDNFFEWHFTIRGPAGTDFEGGIYHGRILLPPDYPFKPPNIIFLTKNGRFEVGTKICLSISAYHPEHWQPAWGVRTMLEAIISFLPTEGAGAIGALDWTPEERKRLATESCSYVCPICGRVEELLPAVGEHGEDTPDAEIASQIAQLHVFGIGDTPNSPSTSGKASDASCKCPPTTTRSNLGMSSSPAPSPSPAAPTTPTGDRKPSAAEPSTPVEESTNESKTATEAASAPMSDTSATPASIRAVRRRVIALRQDADQQVDPVDREGNRAHTQTQPDIEERQGILLERDWFSDIAGVVLVVLAIAIGLLSYRIYMRHVFGDYSDEL